ncbi:ABC transporter ATP-binding protein [Actinospongicola halichondriae]|uniref:ABC transporter ATP-binding protein n=1 Tax=Actinospongicola halichondriae TaxID=3236844 RepID=UPI003D4EAD64
MSLLEVRGVNVQFGGHRAVRDVDLDVDAGMVTGLIGPNGAGKTTTFNVITGLQETVSGVVRVDGQDISNKKAHQRAQLGIARTFQRLEVFGSLTARDNILTAAEIRKSWSRDRSFDPRAETELLIDRVGIRAVADERVDAMPTGLARLVELGRALATRPRVLLLDEPASGLDESESESFAQLLLDLAADGMAVLMVEHDVQMVMQVCSLVHVLDFGAILAVGTPSEIQNDAAVLDAYLGSST